MGDFEKLLETVWEVPRTPLTLYLGSRTPKHSVISVFDNERVDFLDFSSKIRYENRNPVRNTVMMTTR